MSPKVVIENCVIVDINTLEETKAEINKRLAQFEHITENYFLCARYCERFRPLAIII